MLGNIGINSNEVNQDGIEKETLQFSSPNSPQIPELILHPLLRSQPIPILSHTTQACKCLGTKKGLCFQGNQHSNSRWECTFFSKTEEEILNHCKHIRRLPKWKNAVNQIKPYKGLYQCVYYSSDRNHVEMHYEKSLQSSNQTKVKSSKRKKEDSNLKKKRKAKDITIGYDEISTPPESINELPLKKSRIQQEFFEFEQGQSIESFQDDFSEKKHVISDNSKTCDILELIQKKLMIPEELITKSQQILLREGFFILLSLRNLKHQMWERLNLPLVIEAELKSILNQLKEESKSLASSPTNNWVQSNQFDKFDEVEISQDLEVNI